MKKIVLSLVLLLFSVFIVTGCGSKTVASGKGGPSKTTAFRTKMNVTAPVYPKTDDTTYKFLNVQVSLPVPQAYYMFDKGLLAKELKGTGYKAEEILDDVHQQVLPNFYIGYYDFAYVPVNVITEYWSGRVQCEKDMWQKGDDYVIIAGAYNGGISLLTAPDFNLDKLDGKTVGIMNPSYNLEMQLNKMLSEVGLKTKAVGGTVDVVYNFPGNIMSDLNNKKLSAVFSWDMYKPQLKQLGFREIKTWDQMGYGQDAPYMVLAVRREILENNPEVVKAVLRAHLASTEKAMESGEYKKAVVDKFNKYYTSLQRQQRPMETFDYNNLKLTYDPNFRFFKDTYGYMDAGKILMKPVKFDSLINLKLFNEVLKEEKKDTIK